MIDTLPICEEEHCQAPVYALGLCFRHYRAHQRLVAELYGERHPGVLGGQQ